MAVIIPKHRQCPSRANNFPECGKGTFHRCDFQFLESMQKEDLGWICSYSCCNWLPHFEMIILLATEAKIVSSSFRELVEPFEIDSFLLFSQIIWFPQQLWDCANNRINWSSHQSLKIVYFQCQFSQESSGENLKSNFSLSWIILFLILFFENYAGVVTFEGKVHFPINFPIDTKWYYESFTNEERRDSWDFNLRSYYAERRLKNL